MLYLLHFDQPIGRAQHYLGCCGEDQLQRRLRDHASGRGAAIVRAVIKRGFAIYLARVFPELGFEQEKRLKKNVSFKNLCPLCCPLLLRMRSDAMRLNTVDLTAQPQRAIWDARPPLSFP